MVELQRPLAISYERLIPLTVEKTSSAVCRMEIFDQPNFLKIFTLVGLWTVADGCVRKSVRKRFLKTEQRIRRESTLHQGAYIKSL